MRERYLSIKEIIDDIDQTQPNLKAARTRERAEEMERLNSELVSKDKEMKKVNWMLQ